MIATSTDDGMAVALTVSILGILVSLAFLGLGWWDSRRRSGVPAGAGDPEDWARSTLVSTREWQAAHSTDDSPVNPPYYSRMSHAPARHRDPNWVQAWLAGVWLLLVGPWDQWRRAHRRAEHPAPPVPAVTEMRVVDPDHAPVRVPFGALINSTHVPHVFQSAPVVVEEIPRPSWDWITRHTDYLNRLARGDHDATEPMPRIPTDVDTEVAV